MGRILIFMLGILLFMTQFIDYGVATADELKNTQKFDEQIKQANDLEKVFLSAGEFRHFKPPICQYLVDSVQRNTILKFPSMDMLSMDIGQNYESTNIFYDGTYVQSGQRKFILKLPLENNIGDLT